MSEEGYGVAGTRWSKDDDEAHGLEKQYDQTTKADYGKAKLTLVPRRIFWNIAAIREYGTEKYHDPENWRKVEASRYRDAAFRHFLAYLDDPKSVDKESGFPHLWHLACNIAFLCEMEDFTPVERNTNDILETPSDLVNITQTWKRSME